MVSPFAQAVYSATRRIPRGKVSTYVLIARAIGRPRAVRAVGNALHQNPCPGPTPCHRVVRSNGELGGYVYGRRRKRQLLESEGVAIDQRGYVRCWERLSEKGKAKSAKEQRKIQNTLSFQL